MIESEQSRVVLKGEIHTSESDLEEERELLVEGVDALVLEGEREDADYGLLRSWYATAMSIVGLVLFDTLYTDHRILVDLAEAQDTELIATRESDAELVENANPLVEVVAAVLFYGIFVGSVFYGLATGDTLGRARVPDARGHWRGVGTVPANVPVGINVTAARRTDVVVVNCDPDLLTDQRVIVDQVVESEEPQCGPTVVPREML